MAQQIKSLDEIMRELPDELQKEVLDFAEFLLARKAKTPRQKRLRMTWAGALSDYRDQFTALELQKKSLEWWGD